MEVSQFRYFRYCGLHTEIYWDVLWKSIPLGHERSPIGQGEKLGLYVVVTKASVNSMVSSREGVSLP